MLVGLAVVVVGAAVVVGFTVVAIVGLAVVVFGASVGNGEGAVVGK